LTGVEASFINGKGDYADIVTNEESKTNGICKFSMCSIELWYREVYCRWKDNLNYKYMFVRFAAADKTSTDGHSLVLYRHGESVWTFQSYIGENEVKFDKEDIFAKECILQLFEETIMVCNLSSVIFGFKGKTTDVFQCNRCYYILFPNE